jgi:general stress protein 26
MATTTRDERETTTPDQHDPATLETLHDKLEGIRFTMFTTRDGTRLRSRPMTTIETDDADTLWFLGNDGSALLADIARDPNGDLAYADNDGSTYVSVSGTATGRDDRAKVKELWNPILNAWWDGPDDPAIRVIEVHVDAAEYWDGPGNRLVRLVGIAAAAVTGDEYDEGEHARIESPSTSR